VAAPAAVLAAPGPGKLKYLAGSESGMGAFITDTVPEDVAEQLRNVQ
jgi:UDPglucose--hexose-1-phosphate uridylyltransferase